MGDPFQGKDFERAGPFKHAVVVSPSDTVDLTNWGFLYVGTAGTVFVDTIGGESNVPFVVANVPYVLEVQVRRVYATGLTASNMVIIY